MTSPIAASRRRDLSTRSLDVLRLLDRIPYAALALPLRLALATVFWRSAMVKLADWNAALALFREEYRLPLLAPEIAAWMATAIELAAPVLLVVGLCVRPAAAALLAMTAVIQFLVYPLAWPVHLQWTAMLLVLLARGAGDWSIDAVVRRRFEGGGAGAVRTAR